MLITTLNKTAKTTFYVVYTNRPNILLRMSRNSYVKHRNVGIQDADAISKPMISKFILSFKTTGDEVGMDLTIANAISLTIFWCIVPQSFNEKWKNIQWIILSFARC